LLLNALFSELSLVKPEKFKVSSAQWQNANFPRIESQSN